MHGRTVVNLFFEPSTRTRTSFDLAAKRLGADVINFDIASSSTVKGETLVDTLHTLEAMRCDAFVVRRKENGTAEFLARNTRTKAAVVNAGDGNHAHPTQGLLDIYTIRRHRPDLSALTVLVCGDILHSRVARSDIHALRTLGIGELRVCGPTNLLPPESELPGCRVIEDFDEAIAGVDAVIMLRLQKERMSLALVPSEQAYYARYGLDARRLRLAQAGLPRDASGSDQPRCRNRVASCRRRAIAHTGTGRQRRLRAYGRTGGTARGLIRKNVRPLLQRSFGEGWGGESASRFVEIREKPDVVPSRHPLARGTPGERLKGISSNRTDEEPRCRCYCAAHCRSR